MFWFLKKKNPKFLEKGGGGECKVHIPWWEFYDKSNLLVCSFFSVLFCCFFCFCLFVVFFFRLFIYFHYYSVLMIFYFVIAHVLIEIKTTHYNAHKERKLLFTSIDKVIVGCYQNNSHYIWPVYQRQSFLKIWWPLKRPFVCLCFTHYHGGV